MKRKRKKISHKKAFGVVVVVKIIFLSNPRERLDDFVNGPSPRNAGNDTNRKSNRQRQRGRMSEYQPSLG